MRKKPNRWIKTMDIEAFDQEGKLTNEMRQWLQKQIVSVLDSAAMHLGIYLDSSDVSVKAINGFPLFRGKRAWSEYGNRLEFVLVNTNTDKLPAGVFEKVVKVAEQKYGFVATPRFNKFRVWLSYS